jgi:chromosome partitioning protein
VHRALLDGAPLAPVTGVREGLDVLAAGPWTDGLADELHRRVHVDGPAALVPARDALVAVGQDYDLVVFDTPPSAAALLDLALSASRFLCCPVRFDQASVDGLTRVDSRRRALAETGLNPDLELLGVVLFGFGTAERRMLRDSRAQLEYLLDGVAPVLPTFIREARKAARHMRAHGVVASEYFLASQEAAPWFEAPPGEESFARNAAGLASDYWEVTREVLSRLTQRIAARPLVPVAS